MTRGLLCIILSSCSLTIEADVLPVWDGRATLMCDASECPGRTAVALALIIVDDAFADLFGQRSARLRHVAVEWHEDDGCDIGCTGRVDAADPARVHVFAGAVVSGSALVHELEHVIADDLWGDVDAGHVLAGLWRDSAFSIEADAQSQIGDSGL